MAEEFHTSADVQTEVGILEGKTAAFAQVEVVIPQSEPKLWAGSDIDTEQASQPDVILQVDGNLDRITFQRLAFGLDAGADDYIIKPFSFDELLARIRSVLRRACGGVKSNILRVEDLTLDTSSGIVKRGGRTIKLSGKEYALLKYMMSNADMILSRDAILSHVWDYSYEGQSNMVDVYIRYLRKKIDGFNERPLIHTCRGRGYMIGGRIG